MQTQTLQGPDIVDPAVLTASSAARLRTRLTGLAAAAAGIGIAVGHLLTVDPNLPSRTYLATLDAHQTRGVLGGLATAVGAFLVLPALAGILGLLKARGAVLGTVGAVLAGIGITALAAGDVLLTLVMGGLIHSDPGTAAAVFNDANSSTAPLLSAPFALAPLFVIGSVLLGAALLRAKAVPAWTAALLILGAILVPFSTGGGLAAGLTLLPLAAALALLGSRVFRSA